ncbi:MAG: hypothetical protein ACTS68_00895 [Candidatus Hodgkinia cicadicola]
MNKCCYGFSIEIVWFAFNLRRVSSVTALVRFEGNLTAEAKHVNHMCGPSCGRKLITTFERGRRWT